jgi:hypothetical protein
MWSVASGGFLPYFRTGHCMARYVASACWRRFFKVADQSGQTN